MRKFFETIWKAVIFRRVCNYCNGSGKVRLSYLSPPSETVKCIVCAGKGTL